MLAAACKIVSWLYLCAQDRLHHLPFGNIFYTPASLLIEALVVSLLLLSPAPSLSLALCLSLSSPLSLSLYTPATFFIEAPAVFLLFLSRALSLSLARCLSRLLAVSLCRFLCTLLQVSSLRRSRSLSSSPTSLSLVRVHSLARPLTLFSCHSVALSFSLSLSVLSLIS